jgi:hypothetical protein
MYVNMHVLKFTILMNSAVEHRLVNLTNEHERKESTFRAAKHEGEQLTYQIDELKKQLHEADIR